MIDRFILGSAQFGQSYGISSSRAIVNSRDVARILDAAYSLGIRFIDTAPGYGESERLLGQNNIKRFSVITKLPKVPNQIQDVGAWVRETVSQSLEKLKIAAAHAVLIHDADQAMGDVGEVLCAALSSLKSEGLTEKIGVSVYSRMEADTLTLRFPLDIVQAPNNPLDHRFSQTAWRENLGKLKPDLHIRSIFLQGLLLMDESEQCNFFPEWKSLWHDWAAWLAETRQSAVGACVRHAARQRHAAGIVVGVESEFQLQQLVAELNEESLQLPKRFSTEGLALINPNSWRQRS